MSREIFSKKIIEDFEKEQNKAIEILKNKISSEDYFILLLNFTLGLGMQFCKNKHKIKDYTLEIVDEFFEMNKHLLTENDE